MSERTYQGKTFSEMSRDDLELALLVELSLCDWHDLSDEPPDAEAVECYAWGRDGGKNTIHILSKYEDGEVVLASRNDDSTGWKRMAAEQFKLQWLWEQVASR
jgi:hypothetical protein